MDTLHLGDIRINRVVELAQGSTTTAILPDATASDIAKPTCR